MLNGIFRALSLFLVVVARVSDEPQDTTVQFTQGASLEGEIVGQVSIRLHRVGLATNSFSVNYRTISNTATAGSDFIGTNGTVFFAESETNQTVYVTLLDDGAQEGEEELKIILENPSGAVELGTITERRIIITDNERDGGTDPTFLPSLSNAVTRLNVRPLGAIVQLHETT